MQYYVLDTSYNWADEMDLDHFTIVSEKELNDYKKELSKVPRDFEYSTYIGSNEEQYFNKDDIEGMLDTAKPISEPEMKVLKKYVSQCDEDPICDFLQAYYEENHDEDDDNMEEDNGEEESDEGEELDLEENGYSKPEDKPDYDYDKNGPVNVISSNPAEYGLTEGVVIYHCWLYGKPWFCGDQSMVPWLVERTKEGWYESFKSTVHWDIKGWYVQPNDDTSREKYYTFGTDSTSRIVGVV